MAKSVSELLIFRQLQGGLAPDLPTRRFAPGPHWGQSPQTPNIGSRSALAMNVVPPTFQTVDTPLDVAPDIKHVKTAAAMLLGAPIGSEQSVDDVLKAKLEELRRLSNRLSLLHAHDALFLTEELFQHSKANVHSARHTLLLASTSH